MLFTHQGRSVDFLRCALVGETVRLERVARGGAVGVGAVVGVDVAHGLACTIEVEIEMAGGKSGISYRGG